MKKLVVLVISIMTFISLNVYADEIYYTNANNVSMTEEQYDYFTEMYWDGFQENVTEEMFNHVLNSGYFGQPIEKTIYDEDLLPSQMIVPSAEIQGTIHETTHKRLVLSKGCGSTSCGITVTLTWKGQPSIKSYDVIGALLYNDLNLIGNPDTYLGYSGGVISYTDPYFVGGGFGTSVKLQTSNTYMQIAQSYDVYGDGIIYASYQHATENISKATSKKYTVGYGGYGGVFHFYGSAVGVFDQMGGVNTTVSI